MIKYGNNDIQYCILCHDMVCSGIDSTGHPILSSNPVLFPTYDSAQSFLKYSIKECLVNGNFSTLQKYVYDIGIIRTTTEKEFTDMDLILNNIYFELSNTENWSINDENAMKMLIKQCVQYGFRKIGLKNEQEIQNLLNNPKYKSIIDLCVPQYVLENPGKFLYVGILTCIPSDKGAILLTTTDDMLNYLEFK